MCMHMHIWLSKLKRSTIHQPPGGETRRVRPHVLRQMPKSLVLALPQGPGQLQLLVSGCGAAHTRALMGVVASDTLTDHSTVIHHPYNSTHFIPAFAGQPANPLAAYMAPVPNQQPHGWILRFVLVLAITVGLVAGAAKVSFALFPENPGPLYTVFALAILIIYGHLAANFVAP